MIIEPIPFLDNPCVRGFLAAFEQATESVVITAPHEDVGGERFLYANQAFLRRSGYSEAELRGKSPRILQGEKTNRAVLNSVAEALAREECFIGQNTNYRKDGGEYIVRWYIAPLRDEANRVAAWFSLQREVPPQPNLREEALFLSTALNQTADSVIVTDLKGDIVFVNSAFTQMTGYSGDEVLGKNARILQSGKQSRSFYADLWHSLLAGHTFRETFINRHKDGHLFFEEATISPVFDHHGEPLYYVAIGKDITELMEKSQSYAQKAYHDALTGLYNRLKFDEVMARKLAGPWPPPRPYSLVVMDIDNFKLINDEYGHGVGDEVLKALAGLLLSKLRHNDLLVRWGGEEFVLLVDNDATKTARLAEKLREAIAGYRFDPRFAVTVSMGVSEVREGDDPDSLFKRADEMVYRSKREGKNRVSVG